MTDEDLRMLASLREQEARNRDPWRVWKTALWQGVGIGIGVAIGRIIYERWFA